MSIKIIISTLVSIQIFAQISSSFLEKESNYRKPTNRIELERNNVVNKGVWIRSNKFRENNPSGKLEDFIFRANSLDADNVLENDFNGYSPVISSYVERNRRSAGPEGEKRHKKGVNNCTSKNCITNNNPADKSLVQSKLLSKLKPTSVFNEYPFEIAVLLDSTRKQLERAKKVHGILNNDNKNNTADVNNNPDNNSSSLVELVVNQNEDFKHMYNVSGDSNAVLTPKRSMRDFESKLIKKIELIEEINSTANPIAATKIDRHVFDKDDIVWHQNAPIDNTRFKVVPKPLIHKINKPISERGLLKVLSMLTKTFKKIMRQHDDIKETHKKMHNMNKDFLKSVEAVTAKFKDFDTKYSFLVKCNEKLKLLEDKFKTKEQYFKAKEMELSKNLIDFETQQKKFLSQQRQFFNIQKLMLSQNEKISARQNGIAKTQSEISHRQNNFARILKKAKQMYSDKHPLPSKINSTPTFTKLNNINKTKDSGVTHTTTNTPATTESVKINLFSIPTVMRLENQDHLLLNEKDEQPVDDLVYKYYFNNTFIDNLMKSKILTSFVSTGDNAESSGVKNKRNEITEMQTTLLLPVSKASGIMEQLIGEKLNRRRRWINHHSQRKSKRRNRGKGNAEIAHDDAVKNGASTANLLGSVITKQKSSNDANLQSNPFLTMATNFCNGIGQNGNKQTLDWCVEKALRRLQSIDTRMPPSSQTGMKNLAKPQRMNNAPIKYILPPTVPSTTEPPRHAESQGSQGWHAESQGLLGVSEPKLMKGSGSSGIANQTELEKIALAGGLFRLPVPSGFANSQGLPSFAMPSYPGSEVLPGFSGSRLGGLQELPILRGPWLLGRFSGSEKSAALVPDVLQSASTTLVTDATSPVYSTTVDPTETQFSSMTTVWLPPSQSLSNMFFPDNDQLESNLKKYELKPDTEGNVYYDGSLHASEIMTDKDSGGFSDIMQLESNSRIEVDPATFDLQAKRRAYLRKFGGLV